MKITATTRQLILLLALDTFLAFVYAGIPLTQPHLRGFIAAVQLGAIIVTFGHALTNFFRTF